MDGNPHLSFPFRKLGRNRVFGDHHIRWYGPAGPRLFVRDRRVVNFNCDVESATPLLTSRGYIATPERGGLVRWYLHPIANGFSHPRLAPSQTHRQSTIATPGNAVTFTFQSMGCFRGRIADEYLVNGPLVDLSHLGFLLIDLLDMRLQTGRR